MTPGGTVVVSGPLDTLMVTVVPCWVGAPAGGAVLRIWPLGTVSLNCWAVAGVYPAFVRAVAACSGVIWVTSGSGWYPEDSVMTTLAPLACGPSLGLQLTTKPLATASEKVSA